MQGETLDCLRKSSSSAVNKLCMQGYLNSCADMFLSGNHYAE